MKQQGYRFFEPCPNVAIVDQLTDHSAVFITLSFQLFRGIDHITCLNGCNEQNRQLHFSNFNEYCENALAAPCYIRISDALSL